MIPDSYLTLSPFAFYPFFPDDYLSLLKCPAGEAVSFCGENGQCDENSACLSNGEFHLCCENAGQDLEETLLGPHYGIGPNYLFENYGPRFPDPIQRRPQGQDEDAVNFEESLSGKEGSVTSGPQAPLMTATDAQTKRRKRRHSLLEPQAELSNAEEVTDEKKEAVVLKRVARHEIPTEPEGNNNNDNNK